MAKEPTYPPTGSTKPDPPPAPPPKRTLDRDAKLDAILGLLDAMAAFLVGGQCRDNSRLYNLVCQRAGQCDCCGGEGVYWNGQATAQCEHCQGTGKLNPNECHACSGRGARWVSHEKGISPVDCEACNGTGKAKQEGEGESDAK